MSLLSPAGRKFRKDRKGHKGKILGKCWSGSILDKGTFGLKAVGAGRVSNRQLEATRKVLTRVIKKIGKLFIRVFPDKVLTKKPAEVRMGNGKGSPEHWVVLVKPGMILFEIDGVDRETAKKVFDLAQYKLSVPTVFVEKDI